MPSLNWIGKEAVANHEKGVPFMLLKKIKTASVGDNSQNLIIHGDNLEAASPSAAMKRSEIQIIRATAP